MQELCFEGHVVSVRAQPTNDGYSLFHLFGGSIMAHINQMRLFFRPDSKIPVKTPAYQNIYTN